MPNAADTAEITAPPSTDSSLPARPYSDRPGWRMDVDPDGLEVVEILESYSASAPVRCGVRGCAASHLNGLLVRLSDDSLAGVGRECGKRHFANSLPARWRAYEQDRARGGQDVVVKNVSDRLDALLSRVASLRRAPIGTDWCAAARKELLSAVGQDIAGALRDRARIADPSLGDPNAADGTDVGGVPRALDGLSFINTYPELRLETLRVRLFELANLDFAKLPPTKRRDWVKWAASVDDEIAAVEAALAEAVKFLARSNLELLPMLLPTGEARTRAQRSAGSWKLPKVPAMS